MAAEVIVAVAAPGTVAAAVVETAAAVEAAVVVEIAAAAAAAAGIVVALEAVDTAAAGLEADTAAAAVPAVDIEVDPAVVDTEPAPEADMVLDPAFAADLLAVPVVADIQLLLLPCCSLLTDVVRIIRVTSRALHY